MNPDLNDSNALVPFELQDNVDHGAAVIYNHISDCLRIFGIEITKKTITK